MENQYIYHYTSAEAFLGMIHSDDSIPKELSFWVSNVYYMNDTKEMTALYDELIKILPAIEKDLNLSGELFSITDFPEIKIENRAINFEDILRKFFFDCLFRDVFVLSFSDQKDTLPMWSLYGKNGNGLCLVFDKEEINKCVDERHRVKEVFYSLSENPAYAFLKDEYLKYYNEKGTDIKNKKLGFIVSVLTALPGRVKNPAYAYENEFRIIDHIVDMGDLGKWNVIIDKNKTTPAERPQNISETKVRVQKGLMIPYKVFKLPIHCLSSVVIGPSVNQKLQCEGLRNLLKGTHLKDEDIIMSSIPYRVL